MTSNNPNRVKNPTAAKPVEKREKPKVSLDDFEVKHLLGKGAFGEVYLVKHNASGKLMALKQMGKELIKAMEKEEHVKNEKRVLTQGRSPFLVKMHYSFQTKECLYLAMEYCPGGDLREFLSAIGVLEEQEAALYFAEMIMAVHHLHNMKFIHRDLKPDNFLIDSHGHLKLADFGLSKATAAPLQTKIEDKTDIDKKRSRYSLLPGQTLERLTESTLQRRFRKTTTLRAGTLSSGDGVEESLTTRVLPKLAQPSYRKMLAKSVVGSPDYMSPEVTAGRRVSVQEGYGEEVDWWSLGCVFFEMILGAPPFQGDSPDEIFENIDNWRQIIPDTLEQYKEHMSPEFFSLIKGFLCEANDRLGRDLSKIQNHAFFTKVKLDWHNLDKIEPPFVPNNPYAHLEGKPTS